MEDEVIWKSFSLTHVEYPKGDKIGLILAVFSLLPLILIVSFITLILFRRDLHTMTFFWGQLLNEALNAVLKNLIRQPRPLKRSTNYVEWGMPSSHSQFMAFFAAYSALFILLTLQRTGSLKERLGGVGLIVGTAGVVMFSRVYLMYHTVGQVGWGAVVGGVFGLVWFGVTKVAFVPFVYPFVANLWISEYLMVRDTTLIPNILRFEYQTSKAEGRARARKGNGKKRERE